MGEKCGENNRKEDCDFSCLGGVVDRLTKEKNRRTKITYYIQGILIFPLFSLAKCYIVYIKLVFFYKILN